jgi:hypothetical protein
MSDNVKTIEEIFIKYCKSLGVDPNDKVKMPWWLKEEFHRIITFTLKEVGKID